MSQTTWLGKDAPVTVNAAGGRQSDTPYFFRGLPPLALAKIAALLHNAASRYEDDRDEPYRDPTVRNWHKIQDWEHIEHAFQHLYADLAGDDSDDHLTHAACRLLMALHQREAARDHT